MSKLTDTLVKAGYVAANQGHGAISRMLWKGASMGDQARSQVLLDLSRLEADPDGSAIRLSLRWIRVCVITYLPPQWWRVYAATAP